MSDRSWRVLFRMGLTHEEIASTLRVSVEDVDAAYRRLVASRMIAEIVARQLRSSWGARLR